MGGQVHEHQVWCMVWRYAVMTLWGRAVGRLVMRPSVSAENVVHLHCRCDVSKFSDGRSSGMCVVDFKKDAWRMYTSIAANFFEGLNYAFIEASFPRVTRPFPVVCAAQLSSAGGLLLGCLCTIICHDRKLLLLARGNHSTATVQ
jgi:hypothetical protein